MPNNIIFQGVYIAEGDPEKMNSPTLHAAGNLGQRFTIQVPIGQQPGAGQFGSAGSSKSYQILRLDSSQANVATRGMLLWWKDRNNYVVSTSQLSSDRNSVAGIVPGVGINPGNYFAAQWKGLNYVQITAADAAAVVTGDKLIPSAADQGRASRVAMGTAPTHTVVGTAKGPVVNTNLILTDLELLGTT